MRVQLTVNGVLVALLCAAAASHCAAESPERLPIARLRPDGIVGTVLLTNADPLPERVAERFVEAAGDDQAGLVIIVGGGKPLTDDAKRAILSSWEKLMPDSVELLPISARDEANDAHNAEAVRQATGIWLTDIDAAHFDATMRGTRLAHELQALLDRRGVLGAQGPVCGILAAETLLDEKTTDVTAGLSLLAGCVVDPVFDRESGGRRLHEMIAKRPGQIGIGLPKDTTLEIRGRELRALDGGSAFVVLSPGNNWHEDTLELRGRQAGDWNQLHRAARDRADPDYLPKEPPTPEVPHGSLVIIGGGGTPPDVLKKFIDLAGGLDEQFVVFPTAMPDPIAPGVDSNFLKRAGVKNVKVLPAREWKEVDAAENLEVLKTAKGVWFGGGRQWRFVDAYEGTKTADLLRDVLRRGGVIGGSSAGATIQGDYLVRGSPFGPEVMMCEGYERGLGFLPGVAIDQHFTARNRFADMTSLMKKYPQFLGIGIDESTALVVQGHTAEIIGNGKVHFYDRRKTTEPGDPDYEVAVAGDKYDFKERKIIPGEEEPVKIADRRSEPLPEAMVKAWQQAGAEVGWMGLSEDASFSFSQIWADGAIPAFKFRKWKTDVVDRLPPPLQPFGLDVFSADLTDAAVGELAAFNSLRRLNIAATNVTDTGLKKLAGLKNLQLLNLDRTKVTDSGLNELRSLTSLEALRVNSTAVTDVGLNELIQLKSLRMLSLEYTQITDGGLKKLDGLAALKSLNLSNTHVTDVGLKELSEMKSLQTLRLSFMKVGDSGLKELARMKSLQTLKLYATQMTDVGLKDLCRSDSLQTLDLGYNDKLTDEGLKELIGLKNLRSLSLNYTQVSDAALKELPGLTSLRALNIWNARVTDMGMKELAKLKGLDELGLGIDETRVTDTGMKELGALKNLRTLVLGGEQVTDAGLKELATLNALQMLVLNDAAVTDAGLKELAALSNLRTLVLAGSKTTSAGRKELREKLPKCQIIYFDAH